MAAMERTMWDIVHRRLNGTSGHAAEYRARVAIAVREHPARRVMSCASSAARVRKCDNSRNRRADIAASNSHSLRQAGMARRGFSPATAGRNDGIPTRPPV
jgi:hypothetical protein